MTMNTLCKNRSCLCAAGYAAIILTLSACAATSQSDAGSVEEGAPGVVTIVKPSQENDTLYAALGEDAGIELLVDNFLIALAADDRVRQRFAKSDIDRFHRLLQSQICELADGPCMYTGDTMKRTHGGMNIQSYEFNAVVEVFMQAMDKTGLPVGTQNRLLAILAPMRADIVGQ